MAIAHSASSPLDQLMAVADKNANGCFIHINPKNVGGGTSIKGFLRNCHHERHQHTVRSDRNSPTLPLRQAVGRKCKLWI